MEQGKTYTITGITVGNTYIVKVLKIGKTYVEVRDVAGKGVGTEPYYVLPSEWQWSETA